MDKLPPLQIISDELITRSPNVLHPKDLQNLFQLCQKQPWLETKQDALFDLWGLCENSSEQFLLNDLLSRFMYLTFEKIKENLSSIQKQITDVWQFSPNKTQVVAIEDPTRADSSKAVIWWLQETFAAIPGWKKSNFVVSIAQAPHRINNDSNIVFVDDFSGTGNKIITKTEWFKKKIKAKGLAGINIKICCVSAMEEAKTEIQKTGNEFFSPILLKKGISDHYVDQALDDAKKNMLRLESTLGNINGNAKKNFPFGYGKAEALYGMDAGNVPNNVFPIFWWDCLKNSKKRLTLLRRLS